MEKELKYYLKEVCDLRRDRKYGGAPHKPILLLSIISSIEKGYITENKIEITPELIGYFKTIWANIVNSKRHHCLFSLPFFHLQSDRFWHIIPKRGFENAINSNIKINGINNLKKIVNYAKFNDDFFGILNSTIERNILKETILKHYFSIENSNFMIDDGYIKSIDEEILKKNSKDYSSELIELEKSLNKAEFEEEQFLRSNLFKKQISLRYQNTCAISELRIDSISNISLIDACHIIPFSISYDDTISNGIALTPTLHRAFDRGLITINEDYKVIVSKSFIEPRNSVYSIKKFEGKRILLPNKNIAYPNIEHLLWHKDNVFIK